MKLKPVFYFLLFFLFSAFCWAASTTTTTLVNLDAPSAEDYKLLLEIIASVKALGPIGIVMVATQIIMLVIKAKILDLGKWNLAVVLGLSAVFGALLLKKDGIGWSEVLLNATTLASLQVFVHQIYVQFIKKETPSAEPVVKS